MSSSHLFQAELRSGLALGGQTTLGLPPFPYERISPKVPQLLGVAAHGFVSCTEAVLCSKYYRTRKTYLNTLSCSKSFTEECGASMRTLVHLPLISQR